MPTSYSKWLRDAKADPPALYPIELVLPPSFTELRLPSNPQPETLTPEKASELTPFGIIKIRLELSMVIINRSVDTKTLRMILKTLRA